MTLEEAIKHCEEIVELKYDEGNEARLQEQDKYADECIACAVEHRQLAEWLRELKAVHDEIDDADDDDEIFIGYLREKMWKAITTRAVKKPSKHGTEGRRMTAREAIEYLKDPIGKREQHDEAISMAIEALRNSPTQMSGTSDLISRQAAVDAICKEWCNCSHDDCENKNMMEAGFDPCDGCSDVDAIMDLPSVEPEIIHCKDCTNWKVQVKDVKGDGLGCCNFHNANFVTSEGYCYWAERRTDE